jgi:DNA polymerase theta
MEDNAQKSNCMEDVLRRIQLPSEILKSYHNFGVKDLYDWQVECLFSTGIWDGGHLIYCAPTSGGKTLVAELLLLKTAILLKKTVIFVLPYVSLVTEKEIYLKKLLARYNRSRPLLERVKVRGFFGDHCKGSRSYKENVLVCTIEKANQIFNSLITRGRGHQLGCVVFDEVHSLGSSFNGHLLEILIR